MFCYLASTLSQKFSKIFVKRKIMHIQSTGDSNIVLALPWILPFIEKVFFSLKSLCILAINYFVKSLQVWKKEWVFFIILFLIILILLINLYKEKILNF